MPKWNCAQIMIQKCQWCCKKLLKFFTWKALQNNWKLVVDQTTNQKASVNTLDDMFDVAHNTVLSIMEYDEQKAFLMAHNDKGTCGCMTTVGMNRTEKEKWKNVVEKKTEKQRCHDNEIEPLTSSIMTGILVKSTDASSAMEECQDEAAKGLKNTKSPPKSKSERKVVLFLSLAAAQDWHKVLGQPLVK